MPKQNILKGKTFRTLMQITASEDGSLPTDILILPKGDWNTQFYGPMQVTDEHCTQIVANFKNNVRKLVPIDVDHDGGRAAGWFTEVRAEEDGVHGKPDWTPYGTELLKNKEYRLFSPEWSFDYVDPEHGSRHGATLIAGSLTNRPLFKELPVLMASDGSNSEKGLTNEKSIMILLGSTDNSQTTMNKKDILEKPVAERSQEEKDFLAKVTDFTDEEKKQLETEKATADKEAADAEAAAKAKEEEEAKAKEEAAKKEEEEKKAAEKLEAERKAKEGKTVTITAAEHEEFMKAKEANIKAQEQLRRVATEQEVNALIANDKGGHILPKNKDAVVNMILTFSEEQKKSFIEFLKAQPEIKITGEKGGSGEGLTAKEKISTLVDEAIKASEGKLNRADAIKQVIAKNPDLAKAYQEEL